MTSSTVAGIPCSRRAEDRGLRDLAGSFMYWSCDDEGEGLFCVTSFAISFAMRLPSAGPWLLPLPQRAVAPRLPARLLASRWLCALDNSVSTRLCRHTPPPIWKNCASTARTGGQVSQRDAGGLAQRIVIVRQRPAATPIKENQKQIRAEIGPAQMCRVCDEVTNVDRHPNISFCRHKS